MRWQSAIRRAFRVAFLERVLLSIVADRTPHELVSRLAPLHTDYPPGTTRIARRHNCWLTLDLTDVHDWYLYWRFRDPRHDILLAHCEPGMRVIDIGANVGRTVLRIANAVGPHGLVLAIEPDPSNMAILKERIRTNNLHNVRTIQSAVGATIGQTYLSPGNPGNVGTKAIAPWGTPVPVTTIDALVDQHLHAKPDLIKIHVEGYEAMALDGAAQTISTYHPTLHIQLHGKVLEQLGTSGESLLQRCEQEGYTLIEAWNGVPIRPRYADPVSKLPGGLGVMCIYCP